VTLVDDAHRHQQHPRPHVERAGHQEIDVRLFQLDLTVLFQSLDERMLQLELGDELNPRRKTMTDDQHEAMEVEHAILGFALVEVKVHVARDGPSRRHCVSRGRLRHSLGGGEEQKSSEVD